VPRRWVFRPIPSLNLSPYPMRSANSANDRAACRPSGITEPPLSFRFAIWSRGRTCFSPTTPHREGPRRRFAAQESGKRLAVFKGIIVVWSPPGNSCEGSSADSFGHARSSFVAIVAKSGLS